MHVEIKKIIKSIYLTVGIVLIALLLVIWFLTHSLATIETVPFGSTISIDDKTYESSGSGKLYKFLSPGEHTLKVEADGYIGTSQQITFKRGLPQKISIYLKKSNDPLVVSAGGKLLSKGNEFNDFYFLDNQTLKKAKAKSGDDQTIKVVDEKPITNPVFTEDIDEIIWSPAKDLALLRKSGQVFIFDFKKYDFVHQTEELWGENIGSIAWSPDNSKIAYYYAPPSGERSLVFADTPNKEITRVLNFNDYGIINPLLRWSPDSEWLLIVPRNDDTSKNKIYLFNSYSRTIQEIADTGDNLDATFSPDGKKILYSSYSVSLETPINSIISIMDKDGSNKQSLDLRAELRKVSWNKDSENIILATYDKATKRESIFRYNTAKKQQSGFVFKDLGDIFVKTLLSSDDNKVIVFEDNSGIKAISVE